MQSMIRQIAIVLPVYNGEKYIRQQIDSILSQTAQNWKLYIRDDASTDGTPRILREYAFLYPERIFLLEDDKQNLGVTNNVFEILSRIDQDYIMFCDQDDIWNPEKVRLLYRCIRQKEQQYPGIPVLVHSDSVIVDQHLHPLCGSFTEYAGLNRRNCRLSNLLQFNIVQGAASIFNKPLLLRMKQWNGNLVSKKIYHDWWCALIAAAFGKIFYYNRPLMLYRQHSRNLVGVGYLRKKSIREVFADNGGDLKVTNYCKVNRLICRKFEETFRQDLSAGQLRVIDHFYNRPNDFLEFLRLGLYREYRIQEILAMFLFGIE